MRQIFTQISLEYELLEDSLPEPKQDYRFAPKHLSSTFSWINTNFLDLPLIFSTRYSYFKSVRKYLIKIYTIHNLNIICGRIWEKGPYRAFSKFAYSNIYISGTIEAMNLKSGMNILPSSCYIHYELWAPPISGMGGARAHWSHLKIAVLCLTLTAHHSGQEACCSFQHWICEVEGPNYLQTKWEAWSSCDLEMVAAWKTVKNRVLRVKVPFLT